MSIRIKNKPVVDEGVLKHAAPLQTSIEEYKKGVLTGDTKLANTARCHMVHELMELARTLRLPAQFKFSSLDQEIISGELEKALIHLLDEAKEQAAITDSDLFTWKQHA